MSPGEAQPSVEDQISTYLLTGMHHSTPEAKAAIRAIIERENTALRAQLAQAGLVQMGLYQEKEALSEQLAEAQKERDEARKQDVNAVLVNIKIAEDNLALKAQLTAALADRDRWIQSFEKQADDLTAVQADVARLTELYESQAKVAAFYRLANTALLKESTAAAAREASLVEALTDYVNAEDWTRKLEDNAIKALTYVYPIGEPSRETALVEAVQEAIDEADGALNNGFPDDAPEVLQSVAGKLHAALARCSPPAAEAET